MNVFSVAPEHVDDYWPAIRHHVERLERETGLVMASKVREDLCRGLKAIWIADAGVAITEVFETPKGWCCHIFGAAGTESQKGQIDAIIATIEQWARSIGCTRVTLQGRKGWARRLRDYRQTGIVLEKEF